MVEINNDNNNRLYRNNEIQKARKIVAIIIIFLIAFLKFIGLWGYVYIYRSLQAVDQNNNKKINVEIPYGSGLTMVSNILKEKGLIKNPKVFRYYLKVKNKADLQAGVYKLAPNMTISQITSVLQKGAENEVINLKILIPEGKNLAGIAKIIAEKTNYSDEDILAKLNDEKFIKNMQKEFPKLLTDVIFSESIKYPLEGYLFPATYSFVEKNPTIETMTYEMIKKSEEILSKYESHMEGMWNTHTFLTMASLIEMETNAKTDRNMVMSVFLNRLNIGMPLQADSTVLYALGAHKSRVLYADLEIESPYNLYKNPGLPPGPISNAGVAAMDAVIAPSESDNLYFITTPDGTSYFAQTLEEHVINRQTYLNLTE